MTLIQIILLSVVVLGCALVAFLMRHNARTEQRRKSLSVIIGKSAVDGRSPGDKGSNRQSADIARRLKEVEALTKHKHNKKSVAMLLRQAGLRMSLARFWVWVAMFNALLCLVFWSSGGSPFMTAMLGMVGVFGLPRLFLNFKAMRRQKAFLQDFADALEAQVRLLKAGMPVGEAISMVGQEFTGPVGEEMSQIYQEQQVGVALDDAAVKAAERMPIPEMQMFATGISVQVQTGASLSEVLMNLAGLIRARHRLKRKVQALSSEAKISAMIIGALPIMVGSALYAINPDYVGLLFTERSGKIMSVGAAIWMSIGVLVMRQMINFKV